MIMLCLKTLFLAKNSSSTDGEQRHSSRDLNSDQGWRWLIMSVTSVVMGQCISMTFVAICSRKGPRQE